MNPFRNIPIKRRLTLIAMAASGVALLLASLGFLRYEQMTSHESLVEELQTTAAILGDNSSAALSFNDAASAIQTLKSLRANTNVIGAAIYTVDGRVFASYQNVGSTAGQEFSPPPLAPDGHRLGDDSLEVFRSVVLGGEKAGSVYLRADLTGISHRLWQYAAVVAALFLVGSLAALLVSALLLTPISRPISRLSEFVARVAADNDYSVRLPKGRDDELGRLSVGVNEMLQQIERRDRALLESQDQLEQRVQERTRELQLEVAERKRAEESLSASESKLSTALTMARAAPWEYDVLQDRFTFNDHFYRLLHTSAEQVGGYVLSAAEYARRFVHPDDIPLVGKEVQAAIAATDAGDSHDLEHRFVYADGGTGYMTVRYFIVKDETGRTVRTYGVNQDISERRKAERLTQTLNRALQTLSSGNSAVVHAAGEDSLLRDMCHAIVERGHYRMAWVGIPMHDAAKSVRAVAMAGAAGGYLNQAVIGWGDDARGQGPSGICIRSGQPQVVQNIADDPRMSFWRETAARSELKSVIVLPLKNQTGVFGILAIYAAEAEAFDPGEVALLTEMADNLSYGISALRTRAAHENSLLRLERSMDSTVRSLASVVEVRDPYTAGHQRRVASIAVEIGKLLGLGEDRLRGLRLGAEIHDIGKINVPSEILAKPGKLTATEFKLIQTHPAAGAAILKDVDFSWPIAEMILQHHERLDGSGYPNGLKDGQIILEARIIAVADVVEAMSSHRPYRPGKGLDAALAEVARGRGTAFDAAAVDACLTLFREQHFQIPP